MNKNLLISIIVVLALGLVGLLLLGGKKGADLTPVDSDVTPTENADVDNNDPVAVEIKRVLALLPRQFTEGGRTVVLDKQTVPNSAQSRFSKRDASTLVAAGDDPVDYVEKIIKFRMEDEDVENASDGHIYRASFYQTQGGVVAIINTSNLQDDSVGATEERIEFAYTAGEWKLVWYGKRSFCSRPQPGTWQPADQLCP